VFRDRTFHSVIIHPPGRAVKGWDLYPLRGGKISFLTEGNPSSTLFFLGFNRLLDFFLSPPVLATRRALRFSPRDDGQWAPHDQFLPSDGSLLSFSRCCRGPEFCAPVFRLGGSCLPPSPFLFLSERNKFFSFSCSHAARLGRHQRLSASYLLFSPSKDFFPFFSLADGLPSPSAFESRRAPPPFFLPDARFFFPLPLFRWTHQFLLPSGNAGCLLFLFSAVIERLDSFYGRVSLSPQRRTRCLSPFSAVRRDRRFFPFPSLGGAGFRIIRPDDRLKDFFIFFPSRRRNLRPVLV